jgi:signal transduction histidine kinase
MVTNDGVEFWARLESSPELRSYASDEERLYRCIVSDISREKMHEQLLTEQFRLLQALINSCESVVAFSLDRSYRYTAYNKPHCEEMQKVWRVNIKIGDCMLDFMTDPGLAFQAKHSMDRTLRGERFIEVVHQKEHNSFHEMEWNPICDEQKQVVGLTVFGRDITDRKRAEEIIRDNNAFLEQKVNERTTELELSKTELEAFSSSVAHDLGSSLITIEGYSRILEEDYAHVLDEEAMSFLHLIRKNAANMSGFIKALQHLARISQGEANFYDVNMQKLIAKIWNDMDADTKENIQIHFADLPEALSDSSLANLIWTNLISNAVKFTRHQPERVITISGVKKDHHVEYCIADTGVGFDMSQYHKLFAVFHKLHCNDEYEGNGVGLAIVQRIVKKHWGKVWAESEIGKGAKFYFTLPIVE